jgi:hypothetical protein
MFPHRNLLVGSLCCGHIYEQVWNGMDYPLGPSNPANAFMDALFAVGSKLPGYPDHPFPRRVPGPYLNRLYTSRSAP